MKIDGEYNFRWITTGKLIRMGIKAGLSERIVKMENPKTAEQGAAHVYRFNRK